MKPNHRERGQSLVEGVLTILAFVLVLIGSIDVGQVLFVHQSIVERVRSASRYGAVHPYDPDAIRNMVLYNQPTVPISSDEEEILFGTGDGEPEPPPGFLGLTREMITVTREDATFNQDRLVITVDGYPFSFFMPGVAGIYKGKPITASIPYEIVS